MIESRLHRSVINTMILYFMCIAIMFITAVVTGSGSVLFFVFTLSSIIIMGIYRNIESLAFFFIALLMNNALVEYPISFLGNVTLTGIIKVYFILFCFISIVKYNKKRRFVIGYTFLGIWALYFGINSIINHISVASTLYSLTFPMMVCIVMQFILLKDRKKKIFLISGLLAGFIFICSCGYLELLCGKTFFYSGWTGVERYRYGILRVGSTVSDPNFLALAEIFLICFINIPILKKIIGTRFCMIWSVLGGISIILTFSRTGIITLTAVFILLKARKHKKYVFILIPLFAILAIPIISVTLSTINMLDVNSALARNRIVEIAMNLWKKRPLVGNGNQAFFNSSNVYIGANRSTMNEYVGELVNFGIIGLGFFITYFILLYRRCIGGFEKLMSDKKNIYYFSIIVSWLLMSYSLDTYYKILIWLLPSITICVNSIEKEVMFNG